MDYKIFYTKEANWDIAKAIEYYSQNVSQKVAVAFYKDFKISESKLLTAIFYEKIYLEYRRFPFSKFPYIFIFEADESRKEIIVYSRSHTSQNPEKYPE